MKLWPKLGPRIIMLGAMTGCTQAGSPAQKQFAATGCAGLQKTACCNAKGCAWNCNTNPTANSPSPNCENTNTGTCNAATTTNARGICPT